MKRLIDPIIKRALLFAALLLSVTHGFAADYDFESNGLYYKILSEEDQTVAVAGHLYNFNKLEIPTQARISLSKTYAVISIIDYAFENYTTLTSVYIPNSVNKIGTHAFYGCSNLTEINVEPSNSTYSSKDGVLFTNDGHRLLIFPNGKKGDYTIPNSVTSIGDYAFYDSTGLTSVNIPDSVIVIGDYAFCDCTGLTSVAISNSVTWINEGTFYGCSNLTSVNIPNSVNKIGWSAFYGCSGLTSVNIPNSITEIWKCAFYGCSSLTSVSIPNSVTYIENEAFSGCSGMTSVSISNSLTIIKKATFYGCSSLTSVNIPNSVTHIEPYAFYGCSSLTSVNIPNSVTLITDFVFDECYNIESIHCESTTPPICAGNTFSEIVYDNATLYIPTEAIDAYMATYPWYRFFGIFDDNSGIESVGTDEAEPVIKVDGGVLTVSAGADSSLPVEVYDTCGKMVYRGHGSRIEGLHPGIYIVRVDDTVKKIII